MHKLPFVPDDESRVSDQFHQVRKAISKIKKYEESFSTPEEARLALDEFAEAWLKFRNTPLDEMTYLSSAPHGPRTYRR